ncbi:GNAT family N-acetyltransferase [Streptomyces sp. NBC_00063]|uniref:GNAT family N-acetyltransferase n=1 Tax=Streptomyces sp. NBC_00063 TaxID=2975638 RepID=UPI00225BF1FE|nr:GNAT family N-acetyltransferase [Streptomyces sp. NBC_00063]MCX5440881.1 GNAT family N-acetyltransferase [Streptomyces sp. NBC_00063]
MIPQRLTAAELLDSAGLLAELLADVVAGGASLGFLVPLAHGEAAAWWRGLAPAVTEGGLAVWAVLDGDRCLGTVSLAFTDKPNGRHRAEVAKLMVHPAARGRGLARTLLTHLEDAAFDAGVRLLVLDTETDSPAEILYRTAGWTRAGVIPDYATDPTGTPHPTTLFYRRLEARDPVRTPQYRSAARYS